jgi:hypothetical protein
MTDANYTHVHPYMQWEWVMRGQAGEGKHLASQHASPLFFQDEARDVQVVQKPLRKLRSARRRCKALIA